MNNMELLDTMNKSFEVEANNYRLELERYLSEGLIPSTSAIKPVVKLLQILMVNLMKQLRLLDRMF